jgi:glucose-6-phosphate isomerase
MTPTFSQYASTKKLETLAKNVIDISQSGVISPERINTFCAESAGFKLLFGTEKVTDEILNALGELAKESDAIGKMRKMQEGAVVNQIHGYPSESRPALHTATRDFFDHPQFSKEASEAAVLAKNEVENLRIFMEEIDKGGKFNELIMIGIGGSDLGPRAHYYALEHLLKTGRRVHFISNVDPDDSAQILNRADLSHSLVVVVSKSGSTLETAVNEKFARSYFEKAGLDPKEHFISVTIPGSLMDTHKNYLKVFHLWEWVGGRFSTTSMVGGVVLSFAFGFSVYWEFLKGAHAMDQEALNPVLNKNIPLLSALLSIWNHNFLGYSTQALIPYSQPLFRYPAHIQQVEMESNGKRVDCYGRPIKFQTAPIIWGEAGTNAQHSFFQLFHQGTSKVPLLIIAFKESVYGEDLEYNGTSSQEKLLANLWAQALALAVGQKDDNPNKVFPGNRPSSILLGRQLTPYSLGSLLSFFENKVAFEGFIWNINSFDQEGVQLGKVLSTQILNHWKERKEGKPGNYPLADAFTKKLDQV